MEIYGFYNGEKKSLAQLAAESGVSYDTLLARYKAGVPFGELVDKVEGGGVSEEMLKEFFARSFQAVYPVGAIYISTVATNPETLFGFGTWEQIQDRFLLAAGSSYAADSTGGEATHTHTLGNAYAKIIYDWTSGNANFMAWSTKAQNWIATRRATNITGFTSGEQNQSLATPLAGTTDAGSNMPPYLAVYVWKRVS